MLEGRQNGTQGKKRQNGTQGKKRQYGTSGKTDKSKWHFT